MSRHWPWIRAFFFLLGGLLWAVPPLTTIDDTLFKADGTRFTGTLLIEWNSFQASDASTIATQSVRVPVVNGVLHAQLVPTTNALTTAYYSVRYLSSSGLDNIERWYVPPSASPVRLRDVRTAAIGTGQSGQDSPTPSTTTVQITDVTGLQSELSGRPQKGPGFAPSRSAVINSAGQIEAAVGNLSDCLRVDGSASPCLTGMPAFPGFVDSETPAGLINGTNTVFTLANAPSPATSLAIFRNGMMQKATVDYTLAGNTITFGSGSIPQAGDMIIASYRLGSTGNSASGDSAGSTVGTISDINIAAAAGIKESKLALRFPTHSNANDPSADQKAALAGTTGAPSASNKFVTEQDLRLTDSRTPRAHGLLSSGHGDTTAGTPVRGDIIVAQGSSPTTWTRLPLGPANRCLMSNGADAVWNTCLFTGFPIGSIPFVDQSGNLAQNSMRLAWDDNNRHLSVGTSESTATLLLHDALPATGTTQLVVRAGQSQSTNPLQSWQDASGGSLATLDAAGNLRTPSIQVGGGLTASYQDRGRATDPQVVHNGDAWFATNGQAQKHVAAGQVHTGPQVLCSSSGSLTSSTSLMTIGSCALPAGLVQPGDRLEIRFDYLHSGSGSSVEVGLRWQGAALLSRTLPAGEARLAGRAEISIGTDTAFWSVESWGGSVPVSAQAGVIQPAGNSTVLEFLGRVTLASGDQIRLGQFTVLRYPAQSNP